MPTYIYEAKDRSGKTTTGSLDADNTSMVAARLRDAGLYIISLKQKEETSPEIKLSGGKKVKPRDVAILVRQWAVMIRAGLNLITCLRTLFAQTSTPKLKSIVGQIRQDVEAGQPLAASLGKHPAVFTPMFVHMVEAGEASGQLDTVLERLADHAEKDYALRRKIVGALTYPSVIIVVVIGVTGFLIGFIVPQFAKVFSDSGKPLPAITQFVVNLSNFIKSPYFLLGFPALLGGGFFGFNRWRRTPDGKLAFDKFMYKLPIFGPVIQKVAVSRFTRTFSTLIESGVSIVPSLEIVERAVGNAVVSKAIGTARVSISQGQGMARPLAETKVFPPMLTEMVAIGEETGALEKMLNQVADFYDSEVETAVESLTSLIEPMVVVMLGGVVGFIVISIVIPMMDIGSAMG